MIIEGAISIKAVIEADKREIQKVFIDKDKKTRDFAYIKRLCKNRGLFVEEMDRNELDKIATGKSYGGILAEVSVRNSDQFTDSDIFLIDGIEDPFNIGYIARALYALGIRNLVLPQRDYSTMEAQMLKSSAGAYEHMNVIISSDLTGLVKSMKKEYRVYGLKRSDESKDIFDTRFAAKSMFLLGGEKRGLSKDLEDLCDEYLYISYGTDFRNALNACSAAAVVATLVYAQKRK